MEPTLGPPGISDKPSATGNDSFKSTIGYMEKQAEPCGFDRGLPVGLQLLSPHLAAATITHQQPPVDDG